MPKLNRDTLNAIFFFVFVVAIGLVSLMVIQPLLSYLIAAVMLVFVTYPVYERLDRYVQRPWLSSALVVLILSFSVIFPAAYLTNVAINESSQVTKAIVTSGIDFLDVQQVEEYVEQVLGQRVDIEQRVEAALQDLGRGLTTQIAALLEAVTNFLIGVFVMIFVMFYLYREGPTILETLRNILPMEESRKDLLFDQVRTVTWAVIVGHLLTSIIQGLVGAIGFFLFGIQNATFWGFVMVILALIPMVGPILLYIPAAAVLFLQGDPVMGAGLVVYALIFVSLVDNFVRPFLVEKQGHIHPALTLVGVLGGLSAFGIMGMFIGPLILAVFVATLKTYEKDEKLAENTA